MLSLSPLHCRWSDGGGRPHGEADAPRRTVIPSHAPPRRSAITSHALPRDVTCGTAQSPPPLRSLRLTFRVISLLFSTRLARTTAATRRAAAWAQ